MVWSRTHLQKGIVVLFRGISFGLVIVTVWWMAVAIPRFVHTLYLHSGEGQVQTVNAYVYTAFYFLIPIRLSFYMAVGIRVLVVAREYLQLAQGKLIPPYPTRQLPKKELPVYWDDAQNPLQEKFRNLKRASWSALLLMIAIDFLYVRWLQWSSRPIAEFLRQLPADILIGSISFILSAPVQQFGKPFTAEMNAVSLVATLCLIWIPTIPLTIGFLNLNSLLYETTRRSLFLVAKGVWSLSVNILSSSNSRSK